VSAVYLQQFPSYSNHYCKKIVIFTYPAFIFCFPWRHPCDYHAICSMDGKTIQWLPKPSQHVPIYLQQFPSYSNRKCKKSPFSRTAAHIFVSPGDAPGAITQNVGWMVSGSQVCESLGVTLWLTYVTKPCICMSRGLANKLLVT